MATGGMDPHLAMDLQVSPTAVVGERALLGRMPQAWLL
jgi:hypothetical protein